MKKIISVIVLVAMVLSLAACAKKTTVSITIPNIGAYDIVQIPQGFKNLGKQEETIQITVNKDGAYPIVIKAEDGTEYTINLTYSKGTATVDAGDLDCIVGVGKP